MSGPIGSMRPGKASRIVANGNNLVGPMKWDVEDNADNLDTTTFESAGTYQGLSGVEQIKYSASGNWNAAKNNYDAPVAIYPQDQFPDFKFYENVSDAIFWDLPIAIIESAKNGAEVKGLVTFEWSGTNNGSFTRPTGNNTSQV